MLAAGAAIVAYLLFQVYQTKQWETYARAHGSKIIEERQGGQCATVGLNGHPRIGASEGKEVWQCADGTWHVRDEI